MFGFDLLLASILLGAGSAVVGKLLQPKPPAIQQPEKPPQEAKKPDRGAMLAANAAIAGPGGAAAGNKSTFLTGPSGVDPNTLNLGRNSLLGE